MDKIQWTNTWTGRGLPLSAEEVLQRVERAYNAVGKPAYCLCDEDFGFVAVADFDALTAEEQSHVVEDIEVNDLCEAVQAWWNLYGFCDCPTDHVEHIYCGGQGPHGIGTFFPPMWGIE